VLTLRPILASWVEGLNVYRLGSSSQVNRLKLQGRGSVMAGGLASYGPSAVETYRQIGIYADRILSGAKPDDLPVVSPQKLERIINLKTAKALRLEISPWLIARANEIID
jgi:putative tryptophan/tyrosine transport system substrate-binding protein